MTLERELERERDEGGDPVLSVKPLGFPWETFDPFLVLRPEEIAQHLFAFDDREEQRAAKTSLEQSRNIE